MKMKPFLRKRKHKTQMKGKLGSMKKNMKLQKGAGVISNKADGYDTKASVMPSLTTLSKEDPVWWARNPKIANTTNPA